MINEPTASDRTRPKALTIRLLCYSFLLFLDTTGNHTYAAQIARMPLVCNSLTNCPTLFLVHAGDYTSKVLSMMRQFL